MSGLIVKPGGLMDLFLMSGLIRNRSPSMVCGLSGQCRERILSSSRNGSPRHSARSACPGSGSMDGCPSRAAIGRPVDFGCGSSSLHRKRRQYSLSHRGNLPVLVTGCFKIVNPQRKNEPLSSLLIKGKERPRGKSLLIKGTHKSCGIKGSQATN